jgi:hypothetical protein
MLGISVLIILKLKMQLLTKNVRDTALCMQIILYKNDKNFDKI